jgi:hypothetical protein
MSKGSKQRPTDKLEFDKGWDIIFGSVKKPTVVLKDPYFKEEDPYEDYKPQDSPVCKE